MLRKNTNGIKKKMYQLERERYVIKFERMLNRTIQSLSFLLFKKKYKVCIRFVEYILVCCVVSSARGILQSKSVFVLRNHVTTSE